MTKEEMENYVENTLHKDCAFWYRILGEMYTRTLGFYQYGDMEIRIDKNRYKFEWMKPDEWCVRKLGLNEK